MQRERERVPAAASPEVISSRGPPPALARTVGTLVRNFRARRPVRAGSLLLTIFGDAIAPRGGAITLGSLIRLAQPFGLRERLVRTSVARLAQEGWLVATRHGRLSEYRLTHAGEQRFAEATRRIYGSSPLDWDRQWTLLVLGSSGGRSREAVREELRWLGFGQIAPGLFAHPSADLEQARVWLQAVNLDSCAWLMKGSSEAAAVDRALVARGWDLQELTRGYRRFERTFRPIEDAFSEPAGWRGAQMQSRSSAQSGFVVRTLLIHEYRRIHLQDPMLPPALLPEGWIGSSAYTLCRGLYARVFSVAERHLSAMAERAAGPLPAAQPTVYARFGGIPTA